MNTQDSPDQKDTAEGPSVHWADSVADQIISTRTKPDGTPKQSYTCASGITPSGVVHIGNFREIISVDLVVRALREKGKQVRFLYSWDDYDVFRKVPKNMPQQEMLLTYLRWPIDKVPDPYGQEESYARHNEVKVENILPAVGILPEFLYQSKNYRASRYAEKIRLSLEKKAAIKVILDRFRTEDLEGDWWPVSVFASKSNKDTTTVTGWDGQWAVSYRDDSTGESETVDLRHTGLVKLPWRIDWPMRWSVEDVDFEPAGKDHHSEGGSWSTAEQICRQIFGIEPPITFKYDFIKAKGRGGKMSSSSGEVIDLYDMMEIYTPELTRYIFAGSRPNTEIAISFDLDVIKIYEDYDQTERYYYGIDQIEASHAETIGRMLAKEKRIYELSQVQPVPDGVLPFAPLQIPFRSLCNLLLIKVGDIDRVIDAFPGTAAARARGELDEKTPAGAENLRRVRQRAACAQFWLKEYAPEDMRFSLRGPSDPKIDLAAVELAAVRGLRDLVQAGLEQFSDDKSLQDAIYAMAKASGMDPKAFFGVVYRILIGKTQGPRLAAFLKTLGPDHVLAMLAGY